MGNARIVLPAPEQLQAQLTNLQVSYPGLVQHFLQLVTENRGQDVSGGVIAAMAVKALDTYLAPLSPYQRSRLRSNMQAALYHLVERVIPDESVRSDALNELVLDAYLG